MPITQSAKKALRVSKRKRGFNLAQKETLNKTVKQFKKLVAAKNTKEATSLVAALQKTIDKSAKTGLIKKNTASRKKSRLAAMLRKAK